MFYKEDLVSLGYYFYDNKIPTGIAIQKMSILYGSGDYEDTPEEQNDRSIENYYIWFAVAGSLDDFSSGGGYKFTLSEAKKEAERLVGQKVQWKDK